MKIARTKNTIRNILSGAVFRVINMILPFASRTVILYVLGEKYLGLSSLFGSVLSFLSLAELGVGSAMVYSMYKPVADNDMATMRALLNLYRKLYRIIGTVILAIGLCLMPFLKSLIHDDVPADVNLYVLYVIYLFNTVLSYWLFAYKNALLQAYQRNDVNSILGAIITPVSYTVMLGSLLLFRNYYYYVLWLPVFTVITNLIRSAYVDKHYPELLPQGNIGEELKRSIIKKTSALIGTKLNTVVLHAADNLVMSAFLGLTAIAIYGNYYTIMSTIIGFLSIAYSAMTAGIGNSLETEHIEKNYSDFERFSFINAWLVSWCSVCFICLYQPVMTIWMGGRAELMFPFVVVLEFALYFFVYTIRKIPVIYKDASGIWWEDRFRPYVCMVVNVVLNICLVQRIGVSGIILSTVFSLCISIPWENYTIFKYVFHRPSGRYYLKMLLYVLTMAIGGAGTYVLCELLPYGIPQLFIRAFICLIVPNAVFILLNFRRQEFKETIAFAKRILKRNY